MSSGSMRPSPYVSDRAIRIFRVVAFISHCFRVPCIELGPWVAIHLLRL